MRQFTGGVLVLLGGALSLSGYKPPTDTAGPLTVKIDGPAQITRTGAPEKLAVVLENSGDAAVHGVLRVQGIDRWTVIPASPVPFSVAAKSAATVDFTVAAAAVAYNAEYPIHAFAE